MLVRVSCHQAPCSPPGHAADVPSRTWMSRLSASAVASLSMFKSHEYFSCEVSTQRHDLNHCSGGVFSTAKPHLPPVEHTLDMQSTSGVRFTRATQGAATGLEGCHATCNGREQRRKLINHPWIINSWSPAAQSLTLDF